LESTARRGGEGSLAKGLAADTLSFTSFLFPRRLKELVGLPGNQRRIKDERSCNAALHWAAAGNIVECVELLLKAGARVNQLARGPLPDFFIEGSRPNTALCAAAWFGAVDAAKVLLRAGADLESADRLGPLQIAAAGGSCQMVNFLLKQGANVNARTDGGFSALHFALEAKAFDCAALLIQNGADVNEYGEWRGQGAWPFAQACELAGAGDADAAKAAAVAELMVASGLDPEMGSRPPPMALAMSAGLQSIVGALQFMGGSLF
jgi:hypothetical protein